MVTATEAPRRTRSRRRPWWSWTAAGGVLLAAVPRLSPTITNRDPDPVFLRFWWSPIASMPTDALVLGALGADLLVATAVALIVLRLLPQRLRSLVRTRVAVMVVLLLAGVAGWVAWSAPHAGDSADLVRSELHRPGSGRAVASAQAVDAIDGALAVPDAPAAHVRILDHGSVPAGPWIVQTVEIVNPDMSDEYEDVRVETLLDPVGGRVLAAWFYGL